MQTYSSFPRIILVLVEPAAGSDNLMDRKDRVCSPGALPTGRDAAACLAGIARERRRSPKDRAHPSNCHPPHAASAGGGHKMHTKEASLGHSRTTRSLSSIGTRLHWSMVAKGDVDEIQETIISQTVAIDTLLSAQQL